MEQQAKKILPGAIVHTEMSKGEYNLDSILANAKKRIALYKAVMRLRKAGLSYSEIMSKTGIKSKSIINYILKANNIK